VSTTFWIVAGLSVLGVLGEWGERGWRRALGLTACCLVLGTVIAVLPSGSPARVSVIVAAAIGLLLLRAWEHDRARAARAG
jgi:hypothetical protein